jgi:hypothetical protein
MKLETLNLLADTNHKSYKLSSSCDDCDFRFMCYTSSCLCCPLTLVKATVTTFGNKQQFVEIDTYPNYVLDVLLAMNISDKLRKECQELVKK